MWVEGYWDELSQAQRADVEAALDLGSNGQPDQAAPALLRAVDGRMSTARQGRPLELFEIVDAVAAELAARESRFKPVPHIVSETRARFEDADAFAVTTAYVTVPGGIDVPGDSDRIDGCDIKFTLPSLRLYDKYVGQSDRAASAEALLTLRRVAAHELTHCHQMGIAATSGLFFSTPGWVTEGSAEWSGYRFVDPRQQAHYWWDKYFKTPAKDLLVSTYDAIGFWSHAADPWALLDFALRQPWEASPQVAGSGRARRDRPRRPVTGDLRHCLHQAAETRGGVGNEVLDSRTSDPLIPRYTS